MSDPGRAAELPLIDEHFTEIAAPADDVWIALIEHLDRGFASPAATTFARAIGCEPTGSSGARPLADGSTIPGFRVTVAEPGRELALEGRHRFSSYALTFRLEPVAPGICRLKAESRAAFPGVFGGAYRVAIIGTKGHVIAVRSLLSKIRREAERRGSAARPAG